MYPKTPPMWKNNEEEMSPKELISLPISSLSFFFEVFDYFNISFEIFSSKYNASA